LFDPMFSLTDGWIWSIFYICSWDSPCPCWVWPRHKINGTEWIRDQHFTLGENTKPEQPQHGNDIRNERQKKK
jgi:hypothetical protein